MGVKHKKTLKQKIIADYRHQIYSLENKNIYPSENINSPTTLHVDKPSYSYILHDISKTLILTLALIGSQIILFFLLTKRILSIPYLSY